MNVGGKKKRVTYLIDELPDEIKAEVNRMVANSKYSYVYISNWLAERGYSVSKSAVSRYAMNYGAFLERAEEVTKELEMFTQAVRENPDKDYTDAGTQLLTAMIIKRIATAVDEFDDLPIDKASHIMVQLSRTKAYKDKIRQDLKSKLELAFKQFEGNIMKIIGSDPELSLKFEKQIKELIEITKAKAMLDEN